MLIRPRSGSLGRLAKQRRLANLVLSAGFVLAMGACGSSGGCGGCTPAQPLPGGQLPASQTVEGGAQIRVTPHGFSAITSILPGLLDTQLAGGFCLPGGSVLAGAVDYCQNDQESCTKGCRVLPTLNSLNVAASASNPQALTVHVDARATASVPLSLGGTCTLGVTVDHLVANLDVILEIDQVTGKLAIHANPITDFSFSGQHFSSDGFVCGLLSDIASLLVTILQGTVEDFAKNLLSPAIATLIQGFLPADLGLVGVMDVGNLLAGVSPGVAAQLEARITPGGYVHMNQQGLSLGVITGLNADRDPTTRTADLASEPALCVPPLPAPRLGDPPTNLRPTPRSSFGLEVAGAFDGVPVDPAADIAMGISRTTLELAGHHLVTSGALCLSVGTSFVSQLNLGTIGLLVPSLGQLGSGQGNDPLLLVTRPQRALTFSIGDNTVASPAVTIGVQHLEVDFYAFLFERYVRAFTLDLTMNIGVNVELEQVPGAQATIKPTLVGIAPENIAIAALNTELIRETPAHLEAVLPSVFSLITPMLGNLPDIAVPSFAGFRLDSPTIHHVTTSQDDFLAIYASLAPSAQMVQLAARDALWSTAVAANGPAPVATALPSSGRARLISVTTPDAATVRGALLHEAGGALPRVVFDADAYDASGRELEWSYQLDHGMWRTWRTGPLVIQDEAFAWQGKYTIGVKSRVKGDYHTVSAASQVPVIIDSVAPHIATDQARWNADTYEIPAFDIVSGKALQYAFGAPDSTAPASAWADGGTIELLRDVAEAYRGSDGSLAVFVRDEIGNTARVRVVPFDGATGGSGGGCSARRTPGAGGALLLMIAGGLVLGRRRPRAAARAIGRHALLAAPWVGATAALVLQIGCGHATQNTDKPPTSSPPVCEANDDCSAADCARGELAFCVEHGCVCASDVPLGRVGTYSDVAVGPDGAIWVSAYAQGHGDLVVAKATEGRIPDEAWEWVDGVPAGPIAVPGSKIRGGIDEAGPDVGMYTSIAIGSDGTPSVAYFDRDAGSLKLAQKRNGAWQIHVVDQGTGALVNDGDAVAGMYSSLTLRSDDGRPGIAYLAHVKTATGTRAEVRFVSAQATQPTSAGDWQTWVVDTAALPAADPATTMFPLPDGLGLFVDSARLPNQAPVVAYYDRTSGDLKVSTLDARTGQFAAPRVLDGSGGVDVGWSPSVAVDASGVVHVAYAGMTGHDLRYVSDAPAATPQVIDSGYRVVGTTIDGLPEPEFHFVGADAALVLPPGGSPQVVYQDATTQELLVAQQHPDGSWTHSSIAGATAPWSGGYGFFAAGALGKTQLVMSTWVVNPPATSFLDTNWVAVFSRPLDAP